MTCSKRWAKPVLPGDLVLGADVVPEVDRHDRRQVVFGDDDPQAVGQTRITERNGRDGGGHAALLVRTGAKGGWDRSARS